MKILIAAYYEFIKNVRDIKMVGILLIFPIIVIFLVSYALSGYFSVDSSKRIPIAYVSQDSGITGKQFDAFLNIKEIKERLEITKYADETAGHKAVDDGRADTMIFLPADLSQKLLKGDKQAIRLYGKKDLAFVESLVGNFTSSCNAVSAVAAAGGSLTPVENNSAVKRIYYTKNSAVPNAKGYYSVLVLLQVLIVGAMFGIQIVSRSHGSDLHIRLQSLPVGRFALASGRIIGSTVYVFLSTVLIILFTKYVYGTNWDGNPLIILGTVFVYSMISVGLGIVVGTLISSYSAALMTVFLIMFFFSAVTGAFSPSGSVDIIGIFTPNYHAKILLFGAVYGYSRQVMAEAALWLSVYAAAILAGAAVLLRRVRNDNI